MRFGKEFLEKKNKVCCANCGNVIGISDGIVIENILCLACYFDVDYIKFDKKEKG